jgi:hypothetical protein
MVASTLILTAVVIKTGGFGILDKRTVTMPAVTAVGSLFVRALTSNVNTGLVAKTSWLGVATASAPEHASRTNAPPVFPDTSTYVTSSFDGVDALSVPATTPGAEPSGIVKLTGGNVGARRTQENVVPLHAPETPVQTHSM